MRYYEILKIKDPPCFRVEDKNGIECNCSRFSVPYGVLIEEVNYNENTNVVKFINRTAINGRIETPKEFKQHLKLLDKEKNPSNKLGCFFLILLTAIVRVFLS